MRFSFILEDKDWYECCMRQYKRQHKMIRILKEMGGIATIFQIKRKTGLTCQYISRILKSSRLWFSEITTDDGVTYWFSDGI